MKESNVRVSRVKVENVSFDLKVESCVRYGIQRFLLQLI